MANTVRLPAEGRSGDAPAWPLSGSAPELWGEWSRENVLYETGDDPYDVNHHAELEEDDGRIQYVTYSRSSGEGFGTEFPLVRIVLTR